MKALFLAFLCLLILGCEDEITIRRIVSIRSHDTIEGSFFLGSGDIGGQEYLLTFYKTRDGGLRRLKMPMDRATIYEDEAVDPYVKAIHNGAYKRSYHGMDTFFVHVPPGTIIKNFRVE